MYKYRPLLDGLLVVLVAYHLYVSSFTKVEESFNVQAIHDMVNYGMLPQNIKENYDHVKFPGVVPRSFVGALLISLAVKALCFVPAWFGVDLLNGGDQQRVLLIARAVLGLANAVLLMKLRDTVDLITFRDRRSKVKGFIGFWYMILLCSQFHILYYALRTLPNFIALPFVNYGLSMLLKGNFAGFTWLAFAGTIFRMEVGLFAVIIALVSSLGFGQTMVQINVLMLVAGTLAGLFVTFMVDSYFWGQFIIPELASFKFNILEGKSVEWGVEPWGAYFTKYLPQLFRPPVVLLLLVPGFINDPAEPLPSKEEPVPEEEEDEEKTQPAVVNHPARYSLRILFISSVLFIAAMSYQPHKEWRFIIYTIPIFSLQAANGLSNITMKWLLSISAKILSVIILANVFIASVLSIFMGYASSYNYPGGNAIVFANSYVQDNYQNRPVTIHMDVAACMSGINRFEEIHNSSITYDKSETLKELLDIWNDVDILITEVDMDHPEQYPVKSTLYKLNSWKKIQSIKTFKTVTIAPLVQIWRDQQKDSSTALTIANRIKDDILNGQITAVKDIIDSTIITADYLYIYERLHKDNDLDAIYKTLAQDKVEEEPVDVDYVEPISFDDVKEQVNQEIDQLEDQVEAQLKHQ